MVENGGIVRSIRNHGIRDLPHRFRAKYPDMQGNRYYKKGRFVSIYYDASPNTMRQVESVLSLNQVVLRQTHLRTRSKLDYVNIQNEDKNPYIRKVRNQELEDSGSMQVQTSASATHGELVNGDGVEQEESVDNVMMEEPQEESVDNVMMEEPQEESVDNVMMEEPQEESADNVMMEEPQEEIVDNVMMEEPGEKH